MADDTNEGCLDAEKDIVSDLDHMSREEFQCKLYVWFEEKGVLSGLRTHLRHQMIEALKTTELGHKISSIQRQNQNISPKYQALNLLIAEYFLQQRYDYSLSVFSSEVPMLSSLPKFSRKYVSGVEGAQNNDFQDIKFNDRDIWDILEALGLPTESDQAQEVYSAYQNNSTTDTLLVWLIRLLTAALRKISVGITAKNKKFIIQEEIKDSKLDRKSPCASNDTSAECSPTDKLNTNLNNAKKKRMVDSASAHSAFPEDCSSRIKIKCNPEKDEENLKTHIEASEVDRIIAQLHERMQNAFDHELEIARRSEWQKCRNMIERSYIERNRISVIEREKLNKMESSVRKKLQQELLVEKQKLIMEEKITLIEMQRRIERELEVERNLLKNEYQRIIQNKSDDMSDLMHNQENSLKLALQAIEHQSNRFEEQETMLDNVLQELEKKSKKELHEPLFQIASPKQTKDAACQTMMVDTNILNTAETKTIDKLKALLDIQQKKMDEALKSSAASVNDKIIPKVETVHKDMQTIDIKVRNSQTNTDDNEHNRKIVQDNFGNKVFVSTASECIPNTRNRANQTNHSDFEMIHSTFTGNFQATQFDHHIKSPIDNNENSCGKNAFNQNPKLDIELDNVCDGSYNSHALKTLRSENVYLKAYNSQQRLQIQELISNHASMKKEINHAHSEVQALSLQLANLEKKNECVCLAKLPTEVNRIKSSQSSLPLKKESSSTNNGVSQEREKKSHSSRKTIVERILQHRKDLLSLNQRAVLSDRTTKNCDPFSTQTTSEEDNTAGEKKRYVRHLHRKKSCKPNRRPKEIFEKIETETSPTDDVVKEAKKRLKMLELESEAVDRSYQEFKLKQSENLIEALSRKLRTEDQSDGSTYRQTTAYLPKSPLGSSSEVFHRNQKYGNTSYRNTITDNINLTVPQTSTSEFIEQMPFNTRQHESPKYNVLRRVHNPTMIIDNSVLQNYITTAQKMSEYLTKNPKSFADSLLRNIDPKKRPMSSVTFNERSPTSFNRFMKFSDWDTYKKNSQVNKDISNNLVAKNSTTDIDKSEKQSEPIKELNSNSNDKYDIEKTTLYANFSNQNSHLKNKSNIFKITNSARRKLLFQRSPDPNKESECISKVNQISPSKLYTHLNTSTTMKNEDSIVNDTISNVTTHLSDQIKSFHKTVIEEKCSNEINVGVVQPSPFDLSQSVYISNNDNHQGTCDDAISDVETHLQGKIESIHETIAQENPNEINIDMIPLSSIDLPKKIYMSGNNTLQASNNVEETFYDSPINHNIHQIKNSYENTDSQIEVLNCPNNLEKNIELSLELNYLKSNDDLKNKADEPFITEPTEQNETSKNMEDDIDTSKEINHVNMSRVTSPIEIELNENQHVLSSNEKKIDEGYSIKNEGSKVKTDIIYDTVSQIDFIVNKKLVLSASNDNHIQINEYPIDLLKTNVNYLKDNMEHTQNRENNKESSQEVLSFKNKFDNEVLLKENKQQKNLTDSVKSEVFQEKSEIKEKDDLQKIPVEYNVLKNPPLKKLTSSEGESQNQQDNNSNKSILSDVVLSEDNVVESSFELSNPSAISIPQISDENESFWN